MAFKKIGTPHPFKTVQSNNENKIEQLCEICNKNQAEFYDGTKKICLSCKKSNKVVE